MRSTLIIRVPEFHRRLSRCGRFTLLVLFVLAINLTNVASAVAFHYDTALSCDGCHNLAMRSDHIYNLIGTDQSSTCLRCHQREANAAPGDHYISTPEAQMPAGLPPLELTPGGDFGWLKKNYTWRNENGTTEYSFGETHGHNIIAADFGYEAASTNPVAPEGMYPSSALQCSSCHDPHGTYRRNWDGSITAEGAPITASGSYNNSPDPNTTSSVSVYRILGGINYQPKSLTGSYAFTANPPTAVSPSSYNRRETLTQTRVAYGSGMSEWCVNCHVYYNKKKDHPAGNSVKIGFAMAALYNSYMSGDTSASSYLSLVPFEVGSTDYAYLKKLAVNDDSQLEGPRNANVSCLSCHRAHASGWDYGLRFNFHVKFTTVVDSMGGAIYPDPSKNSSVAQGRKAVETKKAYYDREATKFGPNRRVLCSKCHAKE